MAKHQSKSQPTWSDVKTKLAAFDRAALLDLIHHLYAASKDNQVFLHARFGLGHNVLEPYKKTIDRWLWLDVLRNQDTSTSQAKRAISDYRKAVGDPGGLAELMVFCCEQAAGFCNDIGQQDEGYFDALVRMFEHAVRSASALPANGRDRLIARLDRVREISHAFGYGVGDDMDFLLAKYTRRSRLTGSRTPARVHCALLFQLMIHHKTQTGRIKIAAILSQHEEVPCDSSSASRSCSAPPMLAPRITAPEPCPAHSDIARPYARRNRVYARNQEIRTAGSRDPRFFQNLANSPSLRSTTTVSNFLLLSTRVFGFQNKTYSWALALSGVEHCWFTVS